ncbi:MAG: hypothetical protein KKC19_01560 [Nanoarchaeota archaeon]|nr:hypothetical protein [Nanoarchaeota archaeon]
MRFLNILDDKERFVMLRSYNDGTDGQDNSHAFSYLYSRKFYKELGDVMGLEKEFLDDYDTRED